MIQVEGLTKYYGKHPAVQDLSFHADRGEILGFLGPNGAGKTTTMRILTSYMPPTSGRASIGGFDVIDDSLEARKMIGYLPETVPLYPELTVREYLRFMGGLRKVEDLPGRIEATLKLVSLNDRADHFIGSLSKGMRQRLGLAQAMLHEPSVLILDEPTIGLDPAQIIEVRELIQSVGEDRTVLLSTHILSEAQQVCDRVLIINKGHIVAEDTPDNLQTQLAGGDRLKATVAGEPAKAGKLLAKLPGVADVTIGGQGELEILTHSDTDQRAAIARSLVEGGFDLLEFRSVGYSLEDIFLKLTREEEE
jgi:ABC-2 type transport system ATP-binding protein